MNQYLILQFIALIGLVDSFYIYFIKKKNKKLACFIGKDCNKVLNSKYGKTFGIHNEIAGIIYYIIIIVLLVQPTVQIMIFLNMIAGLSTLFTLYLLFVQLVILKEWCDYCLFASLINIAIFVALLLW